jgi:hypothetical protein
MLDRVLGPLVDDHSIEQAIKGVLLPRRNLIGVWSDEVSRQQPEFSTVRIERPKTVKVRWSISRFAEDQLPALLVLNGGTVGEPYRDGEGRYQATWSMVVAGVAQGTNEDVTRGIASRMSRAAMGVLASMLPKVDDRIGTVRWQGAEDPIDYRSKDDVRSRCAFGQRFTVTVGDIMCDLVGLPVDWDETDPPMGEPPLDTGDLGTVASARVESAVPVDEPV